MSTDTDRTPVMTVEEAAPIVVGMMDGIRPTQQQIDAVTGARAVAAAAPAVGVSAALAKTLAAVGAGSSSTGKRSGGGGGSSRSAGRNQHTGARGSEPKPKASAASKSSSSSSSSAGAAGASKRPSKATASASGADGSDGAYAPHRGGLYASGAASDMAVDSSDERDMSSRSGGSSARGSADSSSGKRYGTRGVRRNYSGMDEGEDAEEEEAAAAGRLIQADDGDGAEAAGNMQPARPALKRQKTSAAGAYRDRSRVGTAGATSSGTGSGGRGILGRRITSRMVDEADMELEMGEGEDDIRLEAASAESDADDVRTPRERGHRGRDGGDEADAGSDDDAKLYDDADAEGSGSSDGLARLRRLQVGDAAGGSNADLLRLAAMAKGDTSSGAAAAAAGTPRRRPKGNGPAAVAVASGSSERLGTPAHARALSRMRQAQVTPGGGVAAAARGSSGAGRPARGFSEDTDQRDDAGDDIDTVPDEASETTAAVAAAADTTEYEDYGGGAADRSARAADDGASAHASHVSGAKRPRREMEQGTGSGSSAARAARGQAAQSTLQQRQQGNGRGQASSSALASQPPAAFIGDARPRLGAEGLTGLLSAPDVLASPNIAFILQQHKLQVEGASGAAGGGAGGLPTSAFSQVGPSTYTFAAPGAAPIQQQILPGGKVATFYPAAYVHIMDAGAAGGAAVGTGGGSGAAGGNSTGGAAAGVRFPTAQDFMWGGGRIAMPLPLPLTSPAPSVLPSAPMAAGTSAHGTHAAVGFVPRALTGAGGASGVSFAPYSHALPAPVAAATATECTGAPSALPAESASSGAPAADASGSADVGGRDTVTEGMTVRDGDDDNSNNKRSRDSPATTVRTPVLGPSAGGQGGSQGGISVTPWQISTSERGGAGASSVGSGQQQQQQQHAWKGGAQGSAEASGSSASTVPRASADMEPSMTTPAYGGMGITSRDASRGGTPGLATIVGDGGFAGGGQTRVGGGHAIALAAESPAAFPAPMFGAATGITPLPSFVGGSFVMGPAFGGSAAGALGIASAGAGSSINHGLGPLKAPALPAPSAAGTRSFGLGGTAAQALAPAATPNVMPQSSLLPFPASSITGSGSGGPAGAGGMFTHLIMGREAFAINPPPPAQALPMAVAATGSQEQKPQPQPQPEPLDGAIRAPAAASELGQRGLHDAAASASPDVGPSGGGSSTSASSSGGRDMGLRIRSPPASVFLLPGGGTQTQQQQQAPSQAFSLGAAGIGSGAAPAESLAPFTTSSPA